MNDVYRLYNKLYQYLSFICFICNHEINNSYTYFNRMFAMTHLKIVLGQEVNVILKPCISSMR